MDHATQSVIARYDRLCEELLERQSLEEQARDEEMSRTRKFYEDSLKQVRIMYERSRSQIDRDLLQMEL
jgi:hypothetical protein